MFSNGSPKFCLVLLSIGLLDVSNAAISNCVAQASTAAAPFCVNPTVNSGGCAAATTACDESTHRCKESIELQNYVYHKISRTCELLNACTPSTAAVQDAITKAQTGPIVACRAETTIPDSTGLSVLKCHACTGNSATDACAAAKTGVPTGAAMAGGAGAAAAAACTSCWSKITFANGAIASSTGSVSRGCASSGTVAPTDNFNWATQTGDLVITCDATQNCNNLDLNIMIKKAADFTTPAPSGGNSNMTTAVPATCPSSATISSVSAVLLVVQMLVVMFFTK